MENITHKRGDSFEIVTTLTDTESGLPVDITSITIRAHMRLNGTLTTDLTVTKTDPTSGIFSLSTSVAVSEAWNATQYLCDIEFDNGGTVFSTETFSITVIEDITYD